MGPKSANELVDGVGDGAKDSGRVAVSFASGSLLAGRGCGIDMARRAGSMAKSGHGSAVKHTPKILVVSASSHVNDWSSISPLYQKVSSEWTSSSRAKGSVVVDGLQL